MMCVYGRGREGAGGQVEKSISPLPALPPNSFRVCVPEATKHRECDRVIGIVHVHVTNTQRSLRTAPSTLCHTHQNTQRPGPPGPRQQNENNPDNNMLLQPCSRWTYTRTLQRASDWAFGEHRVGKERQDGLKREKTDLWLLQKEGMRLWWELPVFTRRSKVWAKSKKQNFLLPWQRYSSSFRHTCTV